MTTILTTHLVIFAYCIVIEYGAENKGNRSKVNLISPDFRMNKEFFIIS
jgi:hypothetical protein